MFVWARPVARKGMMRSVERKQARVRGLWLVTDAAATRRGENGHKERLVGIGGCVVTVLSRKSCWLLAASWIPIRLQDRNTHGGDVLKLPRRLACAGGGKMAGQVESISRGCVWWCAVLTSSVR